LAYWVFFVVESVLPPDAELELLAPTFLIAGPSEPSLFFSSTFVSFDFFWAAGAGTGTGAGAGARFLLESILVESANFVY
jgi:hypothetical protein